MTLQTLEYFIAVTQYRNFTKAAQACLVTQPALSRAIRGLEEELGCTLLVRSGRRVDLTPEGEVCLAEAKRVLQQCEELKLRVREAGRKEQKPLRLGYLIHSSLNNLVLTLEKLAPEGLPFTLMTEYGSTPEIKEKFLNGELDIMLLPDPCIADLRGIGYMRILRGRAYAVVGKAHPFYERDRISVAELKDQSLILWDDRMRLLNERYIRMFREAGFEPNIVDRCGKMADVAAAATLNNTVGFAVESSSKASMGECRAVLIEDSPREFGQILVWHEEDRSSQLAMLRRTLLPLSDEGEQKL